MKADDNYYYFTYSAKVDLDSVWYQIATGTEFTTATMASDWSRFYYDGSAGSAKLKISKNNSNLEAGKTYYVRAVSSADRPEEEELGEISVAQAKEYMEEGHFGKYNMYPKFRAAVEFLEKREGRSALITSFDKFDEALKGKTGTVIR